MVIWEGSRLEAMGSTGTKALPAESNEALREVLRGFVADCEHPTDAARKLGITHATISFLLDGTRGFGGRTIAALQRVRPAAVASALGGLDVAHAPTPTPVPVLDAVDASRERAIRAYLELHSDATEADARELATWAQLANLEDIPRSPSWWLRIMDRAAELRAEMLAR
jgi:hypothetical protein